VEWASSPLGVILRAAVRTNSLSSKSWLLFLEVANIGSESCFESSRGKTKETPEMESALTQRALRVFAVLENYRAGSPDILNALLPFFEPILSEFPGHTFDTNDFARRVTEAYRWNFTSDIVEELIPRFEAKGWLKNIAGTQQERIYKVTYDSSLASAPNESDVKIGQILITVAQEFSDFIKLVSPLTAFTRTTNDLADILVDWLVSIDAYTEDVLRQKAVQTTKVEGQIGLTVVVKDTSDLSSEERYLCARFVKHLFDKKSEHVADLCRLASVGLLTEVVQDFHKPTTQVSKTNLCVYLDAPVALDLLGVSGKEAAANIRPILKMLQEIGGTVRIFRVSVDELQRALDAVLRRNAPERTGATAEAMRRNEVLEAYVRQVAHDPVTALSDYGVAVIDRKLSQFPNEHEYFTKENYEKFFSLLTWHLEIPRREHDATIVAQIMRMRGGKQSRDLFQVRHILVMRNALLAQSAKAFCIKEDLSAAISVGPAIHQRQLATAIWLRTGLSNSGQEIPRRYLLAACERVLELKKNVVDQVRMVAKNLTPEKAQQLDLLLTQDRSSQLLMDKTLGAANVVNVNNLEPLIDEMKRSLVDEIKSDAANSIAVVQGDAATKVRKAHQRRREAEQQSADFKRSLTTTEVEDKQIIEGLLREVNGEMIVRHRLLKLGIAFIILLIGFLPYLTETVSGAAKIWCVIISGLIAALFAFFQIFDKRMGISDFVANWGAARLEALSQARGIKPKLGRFSVKHLDGRFKIVPDFEMD
jgi:hypothetical protein